MWFRVRYSTLKIPPVSFSDLIVSLERLPDTWRNRNCVFELKRARDFLTMNNCELHYTVTGQVCEMAFFVKAVALFDQDSGKQKKFELSGNDTSVTVPSSSSFSLNDYLSTADIRFAIPRPSASSA